MERNSKTVLALIKEGRSTEQIVELLLPFEPFYEELTEAESIIRNRKVIKRYVESVYARFVVAPSVMPTIDKNLPDEYIERVWLRYKNDLKTWGLKKSKSVLRLASFLKSYSQYEIRLIDGQIRKEPMALKELQGHGYKVHAWALLKKLPFDGGLFVYAIEEAHECTIGM